MRERVKERGFSGVCVTDERNHAEGNGLARAAARGALAADSFDGLLDLRDAVADAAAIGFEFLFARAACADATTEAGKFFAASGEARKQIIQLREFHLQLAFARAGMRGKNVEDELSAINDAAANSLLHVAKLNGREVVVHDDERDTMKFRFHADLVNLAAANECGWIERFANLQQGACDVCAGADGQFLKLLERVTARGRRIAGAAARRFFQADTDQQDAFAIVNGLRSFHRAGAGRLGLNLAGDNLI